MKIMWPACMENGEWVVMVYIKETQELGMLMNRFSSKGNAEVCIVANLEYPNMRTVSEREGEPQSGT